MEYHERTRFFFKKALNRNHLSYIYFTTLELSLLVNQTISAIADTWTCYAKIDFGLWNTILMTGGDFSYFSSWWLFFRTLLQTLHNTFGISWLETIWKCSSVNWIWKLIQFHSHMNACLQKEAFNCHWLSPYVYISSSMVGSLKCKKWKLTALNCINFFLLDSES